MKTSSVKALYSIQSNDQRRLLLNKVEIADSFFSRMKGLLQRDGFTESDGILITPCNYVHTIGMRFSIDLVFLNKQNRVVGLKRNMKKNRFAGIMQAKHTLELPAGKLESLAIGMGDRLSW